MHVVLIETSCNQRYIFATNKLRENVGASELTYRVGTKTVLEAVERVTQKKIYEDGDWSGTKLRGNLLDGDQNPRIGKDDNKVEVIVATSGKAILLVDERTTGEQVIRGVTQTALKEMPGLTVHGTISSEVKNDLLDIHRALGEVHRNLENIRHQVPSNEHRFQRLPFFAQCKTSGLPAQTFGKEGSDQILLSTLSATKQRHSEAGRLRLEAVLQSAQKDIHLTKNSDELEKKFKELDWVAVVHADGNGLGQIFLDFDRYAGSDEGNQNWSGRKYVEDYRKFSVALDICTINATALALKNMQTAWQENIPNILTIEVPSIPLVLGGDDLTLLCDGAYALKFAHDFLTAFEEQTSIEHDLVGSIVKQISQRAFGKDHLGICAGVAIVKPHFPFHQAYELAESLLRSAKQVKERIHHRPKAQTETGEQAKEVSLPASALDFHILYDSAYSELGTIREKLIVDEDHTRLYAKPYVISNIQADEIRFDKVEDTEMNNNWFRHRRFSELENRVKKMIENDPDDPNKHALPNSQLHALREALFLGSVEADARMKLIRQRYQGLEGILVDGMSLFFAETDGGGKERGTHFMDALEVIEFWKGFAAPKPNGRGEQQT